MYTVPKKNGGKRNIFNPARETKAIQYALMSVLLRHLPVSDIAVAYREGLSSPLLSCASKHADRRFTVSIDFKNFFPSIRPDDLIKTIQNEFGSTALAEDDLTFLNNALFTSFRGRWFLAIGAPSSPMISNAVMRAVDTRIIATAYSVAEDAVVTRYADDLVLSTNIKGACKEFVIALTAVLQETESPALTMNDQKTKYASTGSSRHVLGLTLTPEGRVTIGRNKKREIRALLHKYLHEGATNEQVVYLRGYLAYCSDVEPEFLNSLALKYGADTFVKLQQS